MELPGDNSRGSEKHLAREPRTHAKEMDHVGQDAAAEAGQEPVGTLVRAGTHPMSTTPGEGVSPPVAATRGFWMLMGYAVVLGIFGAFAALVFLGIIGRGAQWYSASDSGWFGGHWWWLAVTVAAGVVVGLLHRLMHLPEQTPGFVADLADEHVDTRLVPGIAVVSAVSLMGGASLGPEKALGAIGGGAGTWLSKRRQLSTDDAQVNTLAGFAGAYSGLFSSPVIIVMMILEVARPGGNQLTKALVGSIVAASVSFGVYFAIAGAFFVDAYQVPTYEYESWQLLVAVGLGLFAAVTVTVLVALIQLMTKLFARMRLPGIAKAALGGLAFGLIGVILPLTMFNGSDQLKTVIHEAGTLGAGLLTVLVIAKMLTFAVSLGSGFVGGPVFPSLFIGGTAGVLVHQMIPGVPLGLAFTCLLAAVPGSLVSAPFAMVLVAAFLTQIGALQTAPILISVVTAYLAMQGVKFLLAKRTQAVAGSGPEGSNA